MFRQRVASATVPAIVLGSGVTALGVTRSLSRESILVGNISNQRDFATRSRWWRAVNSSAEKFPTASDLAEHLVALGVDRAVLFPCSDAWVRAAATLDPALAKRFPSATTVNHHELLTDKACFAQVVENCGVPHPQTFFIRTRAELESIDDRCLQGAFLKPKNSQSFACRFGVKGFPIENRADALRHFDLASSAGFGMVLQEFIPGPPANHHFIDGFVDRAGKVCMFGRRRVRMDPPSLGNSTCTESVPLEHVASAVDSVQRLIRTIRLRGIFSAEFKVDERDGAFKIIEINPRPWWYVGFATTCGVNVCAMAYRDAIGEHVEPVLEYRVGARCTYLNEDWRSCRRLHREGRLTLMEWGRSWLGSSHMVLAWDDPLPGLEHLSNAALRFVRNRFATRRPAGFVHSDNVSVESGRPAARVSTLRMGRL